MGRRLIVVVLLALVASVTAARAGAGLLADPFLPQEWWLSHIGADPAQAPGPGVPIVIVDSGTDPTHPEFAGRPNTTFLDDQTTFGRDEYHGTAVASVAAAPDNGVGLDGVYPQASLLLFDASPSGPITDATAIAGIDAAAAHCPAVINLSFGSTDPDPDLKNALLSAFARGCLVVASSGNFGDQGNPVTYPAAWPHVLTVGATDQNDQVTPFSSRGPGLDVVAPGTNIEAAVPLTRNSTGYDVVGGTSFSAPIVSAAAAWIWTVRPTLSVTQLTQLIRETARDIGPPGFDIAAGWGIVDIPAALGAATPPNDPGEPNDDVDEVKPGRLLSQGQVALTSTSRPSTRIAASLDASDDPRDVYRIWVPAKRYVHVSVSADGAAAARIWGPQTAGVGEGLAARRRDLRGQRMYGGRQGSTAYVEVLLTGRSGTARYTLGVTAAKK